MRSIAQFTVLLRFRVDRVTVAPRQRLKSLYSTDTSAWPLLLSTSEQHRSLGTTGGQA